MKDKYLQEKIPISIIVAMAKNNVIGLNNQMPWGHLPIDLKHFKSITLGNPVIMGRKTFESIGKPLPYRTNIIISSNKDLKINNCIVVSSLVEALEIAKFEFPSEIFIIGGGQIYNTALNLDIIDNLYITYIDFISKGDTFFPNFNRNKFIKKKLYSSKKDSFNKYNCDFFKFVKK